MAEEPLIKLENVNKSFRMDKRTKRELTVLHKINLSVKEKEFLAIVGPSGAGKTTLLNIMGTLDRPTKGEVYFRGRNLSDLKDKDLTGLRLNEIGFVFQNYNLIPTLTVMENIAVTQIADAKIGRDDDRANKLIELVGLTARRDHRPSQLSGGEQQRVAIARALFPSPSVILADEPTGNLDSKAGEKIIELFKDLNESTGTAVVLVTHNERLAEYSRRIVEIIDGRID
jgi:ABC-type lipoprotein export system ATPase subunit